jgi:N-acetylglucosaminyldiphosphoundecaprenol N-acetyl-beta-D-mannosaminyltransferase
MMDKSELEYFRFKGIKINNVGLEDIVQVIYNNIRQKGYICLNDVRNVMVATEDNNLCHSINESLLSIADGTPLTWYGRLLGCKRIQRVAGFELMAHMLENNNGITHYLLGDTEETICRVIAKANKANSNLKVAWHSPPFREQFSEQENDAIFEKINGADPDIVWVSFGGVKQEKWMHQNIGKLRRGVVVGIGAAFRFYLGDIYVPPKIFQKLGLQWFFRMIRSKRAFQAYLHTLPKFCIYFPFEVVKSRNRDAE